MRPGRGRGCTGRARTGRGAGRAISASRSASETSRLRSASSLKASNASSNWSRGQVKPQLVQPCPQPCPAAELAQHQGAAGPSDGLRVHDLEGRPFLQHAVLVDAGRVSEGVRADDRLVRAAPGKPVMSLTSRLVLYIWRVSIFVLTRPWSAPRVSIVMMTSSREAFPARSPSPLMQPSTWRAPTSTAAMLLGGGVAQVVMAVDADDGTVNVRDVLPDQPYALGELRRQRVADRIRYVDGRRARVDAGPRPSGTGIRGRSGWRPWARTRRRRSSAWPARPTPSPGPAPSSGFLRSRSIRWTSELEMNVWMRGRSASLDRFPTRRRCPRAHTGRGRR